MYREYNGGELVNLHITASYGLSSIRQSAKKCELSSFPMRGLMSLSSALLSLLQAHLLQELLPHIFFLVFYISGMKSYSKNTFGC